MQWTATEQELKRMHRAGWSTGELQLSDGTWFVSGTNGKNVIDARAATQTEAWRQAAQAKLMGMLSAREG